MQIKIIYIIIFIIILDRKIINYFKFVKNRYLYNKALYYLYRNDVHNKPLNSIIKLKKVVYSALLGKYDIIQPFNLQKGFDFILFTDVININNNETNWTILPLPKELNNLNLSRVKKQRFIKLHPHLFFRNYNLSIYIDTTFQIQGDLNEFLLRVLTPKYNIYNFEHPKRNNIFEEAFIVAKIRKEKKIMIKLIKERYRKEKFPDNNGLIEGCLIIRKHNEKNCIYLMNKWFEEIEKYSHRDQLSFNYAIWKTGIKIKYISKIFALNYFKQFLHLQNKNLFLGKAMHKNI